jgi:hypothetical protein
MNIIIQIYNWSIVVSAIVIFYSCLNDDKFQDGMPLGLNKYAALFICIVPILNTYIVFKFIQLDILQPIKSWIMFKYVIWKVNKIIKKFNKRQDDTRRI